MGINNYMSKFNQYCDNLITLLEQAAETTGKEALDSFLKNSPNSLSIIIKKYFEAVTENLKAKKSKEVFGSEQKVITPEEFYNSVIEPLAIDNPDNVVVELPIRFNQGFFDDFLNSLTDFSKIDLPDLLTGEKRTNLFPKINAFKDVDPQAVKGLHKKMKTINRINMPGGRDAYNVLKNMYPQHLDNILKNYQYETTIKTNEAGEDWTDLMFLKQYIFPVLKALRFPYKNPLEASHKWATSYLDSFIKAASEDRKREYNKRGLWRGARASNYADKQAKREMLS